MLVAAGVFNIVIWPRFARAIAADDRSWSAGAWSSAPTGFFWVHAVLIVTAMAFGLAVAVIGVRALLSHRASR